MAQFTNQATITYNGITVNSNIVTGEITQVLSAEKEATTDSYTPGEIVTYVVSIQNSGATDYTGLTITDNLGEYTFGTGTLVPLTYEGSPVLYIVNGQTQASPTVTAGPPLTISGISVPAGGNVTVIYRVRANEFAPLNTGNTIINTATVSGGGLSESIVASNTITVEGGPVLTIFKALTPTTVVENGQIQYTFTIQNSGTEEADAADSVVITDIFNPALESPIVVTLNGTVLSEAGNYTYDAATGTFTTLPGRITVPAATITQDSVTGAYSITPGVTTVTVTGTI